jgi:hypothetical protein
MTFYGSLCRKTPISQPICIGTLQWKDMIQSILYATLIAKFQYFPYYSNNFQTNYTSEYGVERGSFVAWKKLLNFKGYISGGIFVIHYSASEIDECMGIASGGGSCPRCAVALGPPVQFGDLTSALPLRLTHTSRMKFVDLSIGHLKNSPVSNGCILTSLWVNSKCVGALPLC